MSKPDNVTSIARLKGTVVETGQAVEINAPRKRKRKKGWRDHVSMVDVGMMQRLELTGGESRVLFALLARVPERGGAEAFAVVDDMARELDVSGSYVSKILRDLRERNVVMKVRNGKYHVNTWLAYNGDFDSWNAEVDDDPEPIWSRGVDVATGEIR